ncbi:MAG: hypothetical protein H6835_14460 [Planctomycetes bacterium]|nr:hypothetical protein [Planctomycetota bacterium]
MTTKRERGPLHDQDVRDEGVQQAVAKKACWGARLPRRGVVILVVCAAVIVIGVAFELL